MKQEESAAGKIEDDVITIADKAKSVTKVVEGLDKRLAAVGALLLK